MSPTRRRVQKAPVKPFELCQGSGTNLLRILAGGRNHSELWGFQYWFIVCCVRSLSGEARNARCKFEKRTHDQSDMDETTSSYDGSMCTMTQTKQCSMNVCFSTTCSLQKLSSFTHVGARFIITHRLHRCMESASVNPGLGVVKFEQVVLYRSEWSL